MFPLNFLVRARYLRPSSLIQFQKLCTAQDQSGSDSSDDEREKKVEHVKHSTTNKEALNKLNMLLQSMLKDNDTGSKHSGLDKELAKPKRRINKKEETNEMVGKAAETKGDPITEAAKEVAKSLGGSVKQTESELLSRLLAPATELKSEDGKEGGKQKSSNISELIAGMKIDHSTETRDRVEYTRAQQVRTILSSQKSYKGQLKVQPTRFPMQKGREPPKFNVPIDKVHLFGGELLGIFNPTDMTSSKASPELKTWKRLEERELRLSVMHPPRNYFEEMILWTEQGKLWKFPINNEQGLEEEAKVSFTEHIFLERHLEPWCPRRGPIRHFMELVCVGLSKNPYLTAQAKQEHIEWFQNYFMQKKDLLQEIGALGEDADNLKPKSISP